MAASGTVLVAGFSTDVDTREKSLDRAAAILAARLGDRPPPEVVLAIRARLKAVFDKYE